MQRRRVPRATDVTILIPPPKSDVYGDMYYETPCSQRSSKYPRTYGGYPHPSFRRFDCVSIWIDHVCGAWNIRRPSQYRNEIQTRSTTLSHPLDREGRHRNAM